MGLLRRRQCPGGQFCLQLVGKPAYEGKDLKAIAAQYGVEDLVIVQGKVPHREALELMRGSDILVVAGFKGPGADLQVPAKLFEYLGVGQPVLALAPQDSAIADVVRRCGILGEVCDPENPEAIASAILRIVSRRNASPIDTAVKPNGSVKQYYRREQVGKVAQLLSTRPQQTL
jgi:glycosyltransferase involved in cell wall biosynthesis